MAKKGRAWKPKSDSMVKPLADPAIQAVLDATAHLTPKEIASRTWLSEQTVRNWRSGKTRYPHRLSVEALASTVNMSYWLLSADEAKMIRAARKGSTKVIKLPSRARSRLAA